MRRKKILLDPVIQNMYISIIRQLQLVIVMMLNSALHFTCANYTDIDSNHVEHSSGLVTYSEPTSDGLVDNNTSVTFKSTVINPPKSNNSRNSGPPTCSSLPFVKFAQHSIPPGRDHLSYALGTSVTYSCNNGYRKVNGSDTATCVVIGSSTKPTTSSSTNFFFPNAKANWTTPTLLCEIVNCGDPGLVDNAERTFTNFTYNSNVSYACETGFIMSGAPFLLCTKEARWNRKPPRCDATCKPIDSPTNGFFVYSDALHRVNSTVSIKCNENYRVSNNRSVLICSAEGKWIGTLPKCEAMTCPPYKPHSGVILRPFRARKPGESALVSCHDGNTRTIKCLKDGTWDIRDFDCPEPQPKMCPIITPLENGRHNGSSKVTGYPDGTLITFICNANYYRDGAPYIRCRHGSWTSRKPRCALHEYGSLSRSPSSSSNQLTVLGTVLFVILFFVLLVLSIILHRLRQRHLEKQYWKRYFGNHTYRQSRTNITATCNQEMRFFCQSRSPVPVTDL